jgi:hypothetical protein
MTQSVSILPTYDNLSVVKTVIVGPLAHSELEHPGPILQVLTSAVLAFPGNFLNFIDFFVILDHILAPQCTYR